jgi:hypothetical protein
MSEAAKQQLTSMAQQDLHCGASQAEKVVMEMVICMRKKSLVSDIYQGSSKSLVRTYVL